MFRDIKSQLPHKNSIVYADLNFLKFFTPHKWNFKTSSKVSLVSLKGTKFKWKLCIGSRMTYCSYFLSKLVLKVLYFGYFSVIFDRFSPGIPVHFSPGMAKIFPGDQIPVPSPTLFKGDSGLPCNTLISCVLTIFELWSPMSTYCFLFWNVVV